MRAFRVSGWSRRTLVLCAIAFVSSWLRSSIAWAAPPSFAERHADLKPADAANETTAENKEREKRWLEHFNLGNAALDAADFKTCEAHFARAWMLHQTAGTAANLGRCENRLGYHADAADHLSRALDLFDSKDKSAEVIARFKAEASEELGNATKQIGTLDVQNAPVGATISLGPKLTFAAPLARLIFLYPGDYLLEVRTQTTVLYSAPLRILAGRSYTRTVSVPKPPEKPNEPPAGAPERAGPRPILPLVVTGAAGAAAFLGVGVGLVVASQARLSDAGKLRSEIGAIFGAQTGACHAPAGALGDLCKKLDAATDDGALLEHIGIAAFVASGAIALGTTAIALWPRPAPLPDKPRQSSGARLSGARVAAGPDGAQVMLEGVW